VSPDPAASSDNGGDEERAAAAAGSTVDRARGSVVGAYDSSLAGGGGGGPNHVSGDRLDSGAGGGGGYGGLQWNGLARDNKSKLQTTIATIQSWTSVLTAEVHDSVHAYHVLKIFIYYLLFIIIYYYRQHSSTQHAPIDGIHRPNPAYPAQDTYAQQHHPY